MEYENLEPKIPQNIGLSFSGGGFRAASYTLGCLSYLENITLNRKKFTDIINFISSASGGTITSLIYTSAQRKGVSFPDFFRTMNEKMLKGTNILDRVFEILEDIEIWKSYPDKTKNIINAFSIAYDEIFFEGAVFGIYWNQQMNVIKEVCANATEFKNGMLFRFQNSGDIGNKFLKFKEDPPSFEKMKRIKLSDILACSSCFTVGFEPFMFPNDFTHRKLSMIDLESSIVQDSRYSPAADQSDDDKPIKFGLMDGGIDDNQGIDSFIRAEERLQRVNKFGHDLFISCDVSSNYTSGYNFSEENKKSIFQKPSILQYLFFIILILSLSLAGIITKTYSELSYAFFGISSALFLLSIILYIKILSASRKAIKEKNTYGIIIFGHISYFLKLKLSSLLQIIDSRATSAGYLAAVVFLKKIRRISYDRLFEKITERKFKKDGTELKRDEDESLIMKIQLKHWRDFSLQNAIYLLSPKNNAQRLMDLKSEKWYKSNPKVNINSMEYDLIILMQPSKALQEVAKLATEMDTTLWFDKNQVDNKQPEALVATGQFTTCYNLLRYAFRFDRSDPVWSRFQSNLVNDWYKFNEENPYWLYNKYSKTNAKFSGL